MLYRSPALLLLVLTACPEADPATKAPEPTELASGRSGSSSGTGGTGSAAAGKSAISTRPTVCPAQQPTECPAPTVCPAECPAPVECPAPTVCAQCPAPYPTMPTTYGPADAWPLPSDHPHGLAAFCHVSLDTVASETVITADLGCGDVNDARWNHINIRYEQTRTKIDSDTGAITQATADRGCYGPHGADAADSCSPGQRCYVDYWVPTQGYVYRTAWGTCLTP